MPKQRNAFRLGVTVLVMIGLLVSLIVFLAGQDWGERRAPFIVRFAHTMSLPLLKPGSDVLCGASRVGQIKEVWFGGEDPQGATKNPEGRLYVYVRGVVNESLGLRSDCRIVAVGPLLGGPGMLVVKDRGVSAKAVSEDVVIDGRDAGSFNTITEMLAKELDDTRPDSLLRSIKSELDPRTAGSLISQVHTSLADINAMTKHLKRELDPQEQDVLLSKLRDAMNNINVMTSLLRQEFEQERETALVAGLHRAIDSLNLGLNEVVEMLQENRGPIRETVIQVEEMGRVMNQQVIAQLAREMDPERADGLLGGVHLALSNANASLNDLNVITGEAKEITLLNAYNVNRALTNLKVASDYLKGGIKYLRLHPWLIFNPPPQANTEGERIATAAREFADASANLDDTMAQLRAILEIKGGSASPEDPAIIEARQKLEEAMGKFGQAEESLWLLLSRQR